MVTGLARKDLSVINGTTSDLSDELILHVLGGSFTCCNRSHPAGVPCDQQKIRDVLLGIYWRLMAMRRDGDMNCVIWADRILQLVRTNPEKYFPSHSWYRSDRVDEMQEHFAGYLPILHRMFEKDTGLEDEEQLPVFGRSTGKLMTI